MKKIFFQIFIMLFFTIFGIAQEKITVSGVVTDAQSKEKIFGANITIIELNTTINTNEYGFYSLSIPQGSYTLQITRKGYEVVQDTLNATESQRKNYSLKEETQQLAEVVVTNKVFKTEIIKPEMSVNTLSSKTIKEMPALLGEVDILKSITTLPGVTNAGEGQSGFNVRGGSADQNLVLLDEAIVYNSSHLFGFFSVFNADAIKDLKLYKGGIPARFGGRLSSVLDIYQKDGNRESHHLNGGIGLISSRILAEGPIVKGKSSYLVAGRSSYAHLFLKLSNNKNSAYFYDLNTKLSYQFNERNNLYLSGYFGRDVFSVNNSFINTYGNTVINLRWNHLFSDKLFSNLSLIYSDYYYGLQLDFIGFDWKSGIKNYNIKYDFKHYLNEKTQLSYGLNAIYYDFNPGRIDPSSSTSGINSKQLAKKYAFESALYFDVEHKISSHLSFNAGLRWSNFYRLGNQEINVYANNQAVVFNSALQLYEKANPVGTKKYGSNEVIAHFAHLEPRLSISYAFDKDKSIKASYNRMAQYLHLISNTQSPTPLDVWTPSDEFLLPQTLNQYAFGYFQNFKNEKYSLEVETFYKDIQNRVDYIDGADLIANDAIEQVVLNGNARAYGLEVLLRKNTGKLTGWMSYTLSRSEQQTAGRTPNETGINNGNWYKTGFDKLHNLSITGMYKLNDKWRFGAIFSLQTGQPVTYPNGQYEYLGIRVPSYGSRNEDNLPIYHHLDISATLTPRKNKFSKWKGEWVFSIYNVYNRKNAASISFRQNADTATNEAVKLSIFGIVPSITYNFKF